MIRPAEEKDLPRLLEMGRHFFDATGYSDIVSLDADSLARTMLQLMDAGVLLVAEKDAVVGMAGALLYPFYFNANHLTGQEVFWWVEPEHRGIGLKLYKALEDEVRARGAKSFSMVALESLNPEKVGEMYRKSGYRLSEHSYIKRL